jgi:hypothetical protein
VDVMARFSFIGEKDLVPSLDIKTYQPDLSIKGLAIRNIVAFQMLANIFLKSESVSEI